MDVKEQDYITKNDLKLWNWSIYKKGGPKVQNTIDTQNTKKKINTHTMKEKKKWDRGNNQVKYRKFAKLIKAINPKNWDSLCVLNQRGKKTICKHITVNLLEDRTVCKENLESN